MGTANGKITGEFRARLLWSEASSTMVVSYSVDTGDVRFERGEWSSTWIRGRNARIKIGQYSSGDKPRWVGVAESKVQEAGIEIDFPLRLQMNLTKEAKRLAIIVAALPCRFGEATKDFKGLIGEGKR